MSENFDLIINFKDSITRPKVCEHKVEMYGTDWPKNSNDREPGKLNKSPNPHVEFDKWKLVYFLICGIIIF